MASFVFGACCFPWKIEIPYHVVSFSLGKIDTPQNFTPELLLWVGAFFSLREGIWKQRSSQTTKEESKKQKKKERLKQRKKEERKIDANRKGKKENETLKGKKRRR